MYKLSTNSIIRLADNAYIPLDEANADYREYLTWLESNTPEPADIPDPQIAINAEALAYLASTDWLLRRHQDEILANVPTTLNAEALSTLLLLRAEARASIV